MIKKRIFKKEAIVLSLLVLGMGACEGPQASSSGQNKSSLFYIEPGEGGGSETEDEVELRGAIPESGVPENPFERGDGVLPDSLGSEYEDVLPPL